MMVGLMVSAVIFILTGLLVSVSLSFYGLIFMFTFMIFVLVGGYVEDWSLFGYGAYADSMSVSLVLLSCWVSLLMTIASYKIMRLNESPKYFNFMVFLLTVTLFVSFTVGDYLGFYFFFEMSLIPTLLIIMGWGYQPERLQAGVYFIFYTLTASLPLLLSILYFHSFLGSVDFLHLSGLLGVKSGVGLGLIFMSVMAFLVSLPMYFTHLWLPKAHVEAPVAGSMILAGVLLKLGGYGLMRLFFVVGPGVVWVSSYFTGLSLVSMFYVGLICCRINDFKALVAYSSVAHMALVICGVMNMYYWGFSGALMMMVGHGLSSSGLFCIVNMYYERLGSRSFYINKGLLLLFPIFSLLLFLLAAANIAAPPTINLLSEIFLTTSIMGFDIFMMLVFPVGTFLGAVFTIFMYSFSQHGSIYYSFYGVSGGNFRELHALILHVFPLNALILAPMLFISL